MGMSELTSGQDAKGRDVRRKSFAALAFLIWLLGPSWALAGGALDGRVFSGVIGPAENPDLADSLHFSDGYFWSDICTRCGFVPGVYTSEETPDGIRFTGVLESDSRGQFDYTGLARHDGTMEVTIQWERKRWYWTSRREIVFQGTLEAGTQAATLIQIRQKMTDMDADANPLCARF